MDSPGGIVFFVCFLLTGQFCSCSDGPVFIDSSSIVATSVANNQANYVTQTVYGFLDFTTTIGNTVMVFSPQSAAAPVIDVTPKPQVQTTVIETKPPSTKPPVPITPSKTQPSNKKPSDPPKQVSTIVQVHPSAANAPQVNQKKIETHSSKKPNKMEDVISIVNTVNTPALSSKVAVVTAPDNKVQQKAPSKINSQPILSSRVAVYQGSSSRVSTPSSVLSSVVQIQTDEEPAVIIGNNIGEPEYDFLSRQPSEVVEETYKVINLKPSSKFHLKPRPSADAKGGLPGKGVASTKRADSSHPTGLVTKLGGTVVKDGITTVHETSVIGTYISGKYAQVLQSTSHIHGPQKAKINPTPSLRILKTAAPSLGKGNKHHRHLEPTPAGTVNEETALPVESLFNSQQNSIRATRKPSGPGGSFKSQFKNRPRKSEGDDEEAEAKKKAQRNRPTASSRSAKHHTSQRPSKYGRSRSRKTTTVSVHSEETTPSPPPAPTKRYLSRRNKQPRASTSPTENSNSPGYTRRGYKPKLQPSSVEQVSSSTSLYKFKLNRSPGRWQYKTTPKPRVTIRKQNEDEETNEMQGTTPLAPQEPAPAANEVVTPLARSDEVDGLVGSESVASIIDDESSTENKLDTPFPLETIKVEISTPPDFKDIYYEIATIKSPYTFQVGSVKNTRYITVTSTFEKSFASTSSESIAPTASEPLTENILSTSNNYGKDNNFLDSSVATLPALYLASDMETPPLETIVDTFSTTQQMLKTHILPLVRGNDTSTTTLVQTYLVTRIVTATKTLPPMDAYHFIPSKTLNEFNSHLDEAGSELHLELEFGDSNEQDEEGHQRKLFPADLDLANIGSDFDLSDVDKTKIPEGHLRLKKAHAPTTPKPSIPEPPPTPGLTPEQLQQLALLRLLNPAAAPPQGQVITTSKPVVKVETVYESHVIPFVNGGNTLLTTISKIVGTVTKTDYEFGTSTIPALPLAPPVNPLFPQQQPQPQFAVTSSPIVQSTVITQTNSKILKLTFGAKTAYTTIFSTKVVPTVLTTYMTASVPVQPTATFPGFFPAPYPAFPYVG